MAPAKKESKMTKTVQLPANVRKAIKGSILGYLHHCTEALELPLKEDRKFHTHGSEIGGEFMSCFIGQTVLAKGTKVFAFEHRRISYSATRLIGDEAYPVPGADIFTTGSDWTLVAMVEIAGEQVLADAYVATEPTECKMIGQVEG